MAALGVAKVGGLFFSQDTTEHWTLYECSHFKLKQTALFYGVLVVSVRSTMEMVISPSSLFLFMNLRPFHVMSNHLYNSSHNQPLLNHC